MRFKKVFVKWFVGPGIFLQESRLRIFSERFPVFPVLPGAFENLVDSVDAYLVCQVSVFAIPYPYRHITHPAYNARPAPAHGFRDTQGNEINIPQCCQ